MHVHKPLFVQRMYWARRCCCPCLAGVYELLLHIQYVAISSRIATVMAKHPLGLSTRKSAECYVKESLHAPEENRRNKQCSTWALCTTGVFHPYVGAMLIGKEVGPMFTRFLNVNPLVWCVVLVCVVLCFLVCLVLCNVVFGFV